MATATAYEKRRIHKDTGIEYGLSDGQWQPTLPDDDAKTFEPVKPDESKQRSDSERAGELRVRSAPVLTSSWDEATRSANVTIATDNPAFSTEVRTGRPVHEVWVMSGLVFDPHIPLLDTHDRSSTDKMKGWVDECSPTSHSCEARLHVSEAEPSTAIKVKDGTIKEVSAGGVPLETTTIPAGQSRTIEGREFTARDDQPLYVHTKFRIREVSLTAKGADAGATIRLFSQENPMHARMRKWLSRIGLDKDASDEKAQKFHDGLPEEARAKCRAYVEKDEDDDEDKEDKSRSDKARKVADEKAEAERKATVEKTETERKAAAESDRIRKEVADAAVNVERERVSNIRKAAEDLPIGEETIRSAIDDGVSLVEATNRFLAAVKLAGLRNGRTIGVGPAIQSRSVEKDLTRDVLATAMVIRSLNNLGSHDTGARFRSDPVEVLNRYVPNNFNTTGFGEWVGRSGSITDPLSEEQRKHNYMLLNQADRFRNLDMVDVMAECCRFDGRPISGYPSRSEVVRAGLSGGSFGALFTNVFNAQLLSGYLEASDTTLGWVTEGDAQNFMPGELAMVGKMNHLTLDGKGGAGEMTYGDWNEPIRVNRYSGTFTVDEKDIINDRFTVLGTNSPQEMGLSARRVRPDLIYSMLLASYSAGTGRGPTLNQDSVQLFHATHKNFLAAASNTLYTHSGAAGVVDTTCLDDAIPAIKCQRLNGIALNLVPRFCIMSPYLLSAVRRALFSTQRIIASGSGGTLNPLQAFDIETRDDARLDDIGAVDPLDKNKAVAGLKYHWFLACRPGENGAKTVHVNYLSGQGRAPQITSFALNGANTPEAIWGIRWAVKLDIGAAPADFRGMYYAESST